MHPHPPPLSPKAMHIYLNPPRSLPSPNPILHAAYIASAPPLPSGPPPCTPAEHPPNPPTPAFAYVTHKGPTPRINTPTEMLNGGDGEQWPMYVRKEWDEEFSAQAWEWGLGGSNEATRQRTPIAVIDDQTVQHMIGTDGIGSHSVCFRCANSYSSAKFKYEEPVERRLSSVVGQ